MSGGFQHPGFQQPGFQGGIASTGTVAQTLPAFTQAATATVGIGEPPEVSVVPTRVATPVRGFIHQTLPSLTQEAIGVVNDDEFVLLLL